MAHTNNQERQNKVKDELFDITNYTLFLAAISNRWTINNDDEKTII